MSLGEEREGERAVKLQPSAARQSQVQGEAQSQVAPLGGGHGAEPGGSEEDGGGVLGAGACR